MRLPRRQSSGRQPGAVAAWGVGFDRLFCELMIPHHEGGIAMARQLRRTGGDPRLKLLCVAIDHAQVGQVVRMRALRP